MSETLQNGHFFGGVRRERRVGGLTLAETGYRPDFVIPPHDHEHPFFCLGLQGTFVERFERSHWRAQPTTVFFHPAGAEHAEVFGEAGGRLFNVQLGRSWLARLERFGVTAPVRQVDGTGGRFSWIAMMLYREFRRHDAASELAIDGLALALIAHVIRDATPEPRGSRPGWLTRVEEMLHDRSGETTDIAGIAAEVDIHPVHLARVFRRHHGVSPAEYARRLRIREACRLLGETDRPLAEVAHVTGYADQSHFTRLFKRALGVTPGEYRRLLS